MAVEFDTVGLRKGSACVICYEKEGDHVLLPCGHGGYCGGCAHSFLSLPPPARLCPICRAALTRAVKVPMNTEIGAVVDVDMAQGAAQMSSSAVPSAGPGDGGTNHFVPPDME